MEAIAKIEPLEITDDRDAQFRVGEWLFTSARKGRPFFIEVTGDNFQATFNASPDDLRDIRDWINRALAEG